MTTDILEKLDNEKPFRSIELPKELLETILLVPRNMGRCHYVPIIKIERKLSCEQVKEMMAYEEEKHREIYQRGARHKRGDK